MSVLPQRRPGRHVATLAVVALVAFVSTVDNTVVVAAAPTIGRDLGMGLSSLPWLSIGYMLPYGGLLLVAGALVDRGGNRVLLAGLAVFAGGSLLGGLAQTAEAVLTARVVQGIAAALVVPGTLRLVRTALDPRWRTPGAAIWTAAVATALALGPWLGGFLTEHAHWSWIFLGHLPLLLAAGLLVPRVGDSAVRRPAPTRVSGAPTSTVASRLRRNPIFLGANAVLLLWGLGTSGVVFYTPLLHQDFLGMSPGRASLPLSVVAVAVIATTPLVPAIQRRLGPARTVALGLTGVAAGMTAVAAVNHVPSVEPRLVGLLVVGVGSALTTPLTAHALDVVDAEDAGVASGLLTAAREVSAAAGIALTGAVLALVNAGQTTGLTGPELARGYTAGLVLAAAAQLAGAALAPRLLRPRVRSPATEPAAAAGR
ncbi:MFS transporter [Streptoalloteichus hindustanus]|uniref:Predicted arabinose efflux permease, MFS family n=1 Tax=Streptoalloteichus hindustanus TaxID=2017 RepID=A0A1M4ZGR4_STRHI|nr:MFS transporter [Streptoalloteichus hindustanus]SHF16776.1 Predicted arabinose efflux permease, MFS family [Streptoalloteichus hindustanus]